MANQGLGEEETAGTLERERKVTFHPAMRQDSLCMFWCVSFLIFSSISARHADIQMSVAQTQTHTLIIKIPHPGF